MATIEGRLDRPFKTAAYQYIRTTDKLPTRAQLGEVAIAKVKLFGGSWTWYIASYDPDTRECYGLVDGHEWEFGSFSMEELVRQRFLFGLPLERDLHWEPRPLTECLR